MLNRLNELNLIKSYFGSYDLFHLNTSLNQSYGDDRCIHIDEKLRLSIDLNNRNKHNDFKLATLNNIAALFYGEIYNFDELIEKIGYQDENKKCLSFSYLCCLLYQKFGAAFAKYINGMFSLVLRDQKDDVLLLVTDRFGSPRPIYYQLSSKLFFSTHLKKLLSTDEIAVEIDTNALALFLKYSYIPAPKTIVKNIHKLKPGEMIICSKGNYRVERYIDFIIKPKKCSEDEAAYQYLTLLTESISNKLDTFNNQKVGVFLSGGLDSSANVAIAAKLNKCNFETFGIGFENPKIDERPYARIVAERFNVPFNDYVFTGDEIEDLPSIIWHLEEPFLENGLFLTYAGFKSAQDKTDIIISGNCADQLFGTGGFAGGKPIALRYLLEKLHILSFMNQIKNFTDTDFFNNDNILFKLKVLLRRCTNFNDWFFWGFDEYELHELCRFKIESSEFDKFPDKFDNTYHDFTDYYQHSIIHQDIEHYACQNVLVKSYRIAEMFGIHGRDPYLDYNVVDFLLSLDLDLKRKGNFSDYLKNRTTSKYLHRKTMENILPDEILTKPKQGGFVNMAILLNDVRRREMIYKYILNSEIVKEYLNSDYVNKMFNAYETLINKKIYWTDYLDSQAGKILSLLVFSLWHNTIVERAAEYDPSLKLMEKLS